MPEANSGPILSNSPGRYARSVTPEAGQKPKLLDRLREALRSRHYSEHEERLVLIGQSHRNRVSHEHSNHRDPVGLEQPGRSGHPTEVLPRLAF